MSPTYSGSSKNVPGFRLGGEHGKVGTGAQASFQLRRLPVRPHGRPGQTHTGPVAVSSEQDIRTAVHTGLPGPTVYVSDRPTHCHREASSPRSVTHAADTMAPQKKLEGPGVTRKEHSGAQVLASTFTMVASGRQRPHRPTITPHKTCAANFYRRIKRRLGRSLKRAYCKRNLVPSRNQTAYQLSRTQSSPIGSERVQRPLHRQNSSCRNRQYHCSGLHKQGGRYEVGPALRASLENLDLVFQQSSHSQSPTHPRPSECCRRQAIQTGTDHSNGVVPPSTSFSYDMQEVAPASSGLIRHEVQQEIIPVCVTSSGPPGHGRRCPQFVLGGSGRIRLPTSSHSGQSGGEVAVHPMQETDSDCPGVAKHALVLGPGSHVQSNPIEPTLSAQLANTAIQSDPSQKSVQPEPPCLAPRASAIKKHINH